MIFRFFKDREHKKKIEYMKKHGSSRKLLYIFDNLAELSLEREWYEFQKTDEKWQDLFSTLSKLSLRHNIVLNVGCGGYELIDVKNDEFSVGLDLSSRSLQILLSFGFKGNVIQAECGCLPFRFKSFECLISNQLIEHMTSIDAVKKTIKEMNYVAKRTIIVTPNCAFFRRIYDPTHFHFFTTKDIKKVIPNSQIYASNISPKYTLRYYLLYDSPKLRNIPIIGESIYNILIKIDTSKTMEIINKKLWVGAHLIIIR